MASALTGSTSETNKQTIRVRPSQHRQGSPSSWSYPDSYLSTGYTGGMAEGAARETRAAHMWLCWSAGCCSPLQSVLSEDQELILPILLVPTVSGGEYRQNRSYITQYLKFCWGEIFEAPILQKKKKKNQQSTYYTQERSRENLVLCLCPLQDQKLLISLQQWKLTIAVAHSPFSYLIGTLLILK